MVIAIMLLAVFIHSSSIVRSLNRSPTLVLRVLLIVIATLVTQYIILSRQRESTIDSNCNFSDTIYI